MRNLGLDFMIRVAALDETPVVNEAPIALAQRLATAKARAVADRLPINDRPYLIIAADTVVALGTVLLGKPADDDDARQMLEQLRNRPHEVHTGISLYAAPSKHTADTGQHHAGFYARLHRCRARCLHRQRRSAGQGRGLCHSTSRIRTRVGD